MFSSGPNYTKLKTNLKLAQNRLKLLAKKKTEIAQKARKEIAEHLATGKTERARIRVEHIIREDYLVEAMEVVEMYCDLLLARFGLVTQMKDMDDGIAEAVYSLVWVCPRMQSDISELKVISDIFVQKYGPQFAERARTATEEHAVSDKLMHKLQLQAPPKLLVEKYLIEIAKNYNIEYEPDPQVINTSDDSKDQYLIDLSDRNNLSEPSTSGQPMGFVNYASVPALPRIPDAAFPKPFNYPNINRGGGGGGGASSSVHAPIATSTPSSTPSNSCEFSYNIPPSTKNDINDGSRRTSSNEHKDLNVHFIKPIKPRTDPNSKAVDKGPPAGKNNQNGDEKLNGGPDVVELPNVPNGNPDEPATNGDDNSEGEDIDFEALAKRFAALKKRK